MPRLRAVLGLVLATGMFVSTAAVTDVRPSGCDTPLTAVSGTTTGLCLHADEPIRGHTAADGTPPAPAPGLSPSCYSDGRDGFRVEVLYLHATGTQDRLPQLATDLRAELGRVDATVASSAARTGAVRHVRWLTEAAPGGGCRIALRSVALDAAALADFDATTQALARAGYDRADRRYLLFADRDDYCGLGSMTSDDRPGPDNEVHQRTGYARVDRSCWFLGAQGTYSTPAHELLHTFGAVQSSAPHATTLGHCTDEWDPLCYSDAADVHVTVVCQDHDPNTNGTTDTDNQLLDCGQDDYFATDPPAGTYLATHWNAADAAWLATTGSTGPGYPDAASTPEPDPQGRRASWPADRGTFRPLVVDGTGFDACTLPVTVRTRGTATTTTSGGIIGIGGSSRTTIAADPALESLADRLVTAVNDIAGAAVLDRGDAVDAAEPAAGEILLAPGTDTEPPVAVWTQGVRIHRAQLLVTDPSAPVETLVPRMLEALGLGRVPTGDRWMGRTGSSGAGDGTQAALRNLYVDACNRDARLDLRAPAERSQLQATATRRARDVAADAATGQAAALAVAADLRSRHGDRWAQTVVLCRDDVFADCLAGAPLLAGGGVVLLVPGGPAGTLPAAVRDEIDQTLALSGRIEILGGTGAVSSAIESDLRSAFPLRTVERLAGADRYETAVAIADALDAGSGATVLLARGDDPADAVAAGAWAAKTGAPVVLTRPAHLVDPTAIWLHHAHPGRIVLLGGPAALSRDVETIASQLAPVSRVQGATRTATAVAIARSPLLWNRTTASGATTVVGVGAYAPTSWQLALVAGPLAADLDAPLVDVAPQAVPGGTPGVIDTSEYLSQMPVDGSVDAESVFVGARLAGVAETVVTRFHALFLPGLSPDVRFVAE